jgi:hypothetical protein
LLFGLEERVVLKWIVDVIAGDRHLAFEISVFALELEMVFDHARESRVLVERHHTSVSVVWGPKVSGRS